MSYLVGRFSRDYFDFTNNDNPMSLVGMVEEISKSHLVSAQQDDDYQVINLITREYYDPKKNLWVKIQKF
jgi:hypothetical protein